MDNQQPKKWYFKTWALVVAFISVGPFMLPLVWYNPDLSKRAKIVIIVVAVIITYFLTFAFLKSLKSLSSYYKLMQNAI